MDWRSIAFDWNLVRAFLVTAEEGSFSAAARSLGLTQPTLGRQVTALEQELNVTLFERAGRSLSLTQSGIELLDQVRAMGAAANQISLVASGQSQNVEGWVSITSSDLSSAYFMLPAIERLRTTAPGIKIDLLSSNEVKDLTKREADIAIRHVRPEQPDLIAKLAGETMGHLFASSAFLEKYGRPTSLEDVANLPFIAFDNAERMRPILNGIGIPVRMDSFKYVTNSGFVLLEMMKQGLGISVLTRASTPDFSELECVLPELISVPVPIWLVTHRELHTSQRIRIVFDILAEAISQVPGVRH